MRLGCGNIFKDGVKQRHDVVSGLLPVGRHPAVLGGAENRGEIELFLSSVEVEHQVEHHLLHLVGTAVGLVDLVDHHHRLQSDLDSLLEHEAGLGHRSLESVDKEQTAVGHIEHTLHLAAEVGVSRSVYYINFSIFVVDGYVLRQDRYAAFAFKVVIVEDKFAGILILTKEVTGKEHFIDERGFTVVHVCDNGDIADILHEN